MKRPRNIQVSVDTEHLNFYISGSNYDPHRLNNTHARWFGVPRAAEAPEANEVDFLRIALYTLKERRAGRLPNALQEQFPDMDEREVGRRYSCAITHIEEALMWLGISDASEAIVQQQITIIETKPEAAT